MLQRIFVTYRLTADPDTDWEVVERVRSFHAERCPVARSIGGSVDITTSLEYLTPGTDSDYRPTGQ